MRMDKHPCHQCELPKLNRIAGQIEGIKGMIEEGRYCPDILVQMRAVRAALKTVEANILEAHLGSCVQNAMAGGNKNDIDRKIAELKDIFKRYEE